MNAGCFFRFSGAEFVPVPGNWRAGHRAALWRTGVIVTGVGGSALSAPGGLTSQPPEDARYVRMPPCAIFFEGGGARNLFERDFKS